MATGDFPSAGQHDLTLIMLNSFKIFHACDEHFSFYTAKTLKRH
jgi:hypothetical protein